MRVLEDPLSVFSSAGKSNDKRTCRNDLVSPLIIFSKLLVSIEISEE